MSLLFLANGAIGILILITFIWGFAKYNKKEEISDEKDKTKKTLDETKNIANWFCLTILGYAILTFLYFFWFWKESEYNLFEFQLIYSLIILFQTIILLKIISLFKQSKKTFFLLLIYLLVLLYSTFSPITIPLLIMISSFFITLIISFNFINSFPVCKRVGYAGILYSSISILLNFLFFFRIGNGLIYELISSTLFLAFAFIFLKDIKKFPLKFKDQVFFKEESHLVLFANYFIFIIVLTTFVLISTVGVHEFSHVVTSRYYGCESRVIAYEEGQYPYTEIICDNEKGKNIIALAGPLVPIIIAILLFILGGSFIKPVSLLIIGFNLIASYRDLREVAATETFSLISSILGLFMIFIGIWFLAKLRINLHHHPITSQI